MHCVRCAERAARTHHGSPTGRNSGCRCRRLFRLMSADEAGTLAAPQEGRRIATLIPNAKFVALESENHVPQLFARRLKSIACSTFASLDRVFVSLGLGRNFLVKFQERSSEPLPLLIEPQFSNLRISGRRKERQIAQSMFCCLMVLDCSTHGFINPGNQTSAAIILTR